MNAEVQLATPEHQARIEQYAEPIVGYLMSIKPSDALHTLVAVTSLVLLSLKHKEGKSPLDTLDDHFIPAVRKTVETGFTEVKP